MDYLFLFSMHVREEKVALSPNNCFLNLIFHGLYYIYNNNKNTSTTPSTEFRAYFPHKAIFQIKDWAKNNWMFLKPQGNPSNIPNCYETPNLKKAICAVPIMVSLWKFLYSCGQGPPSAHEVMSHSR